MNVFGNKFKVTIFGESHGEAIGVVLDGVPAGLELSAEDFHQDIGRRRSGARGTTPRREADVPNILSGVYQGRTTGAPLAVVFRNTNTRSSDYDLFRICPRPGHADWVAGVKWHGYNDPRGGGHFSGRLTLPLVAAGVVAKKIIAAAPASTVSAPAAAAVPAPAAAAVPVPDGSGSVSSAAPHPAIAAKIISIGGVSRERALARAAGSGTIPPSAPTGTPDTSSLATSCASSTPVSAPDSLPDHDLWREELDAAIREGDSLGGIVECTVTGLPVGLGSPFFDSVESLISHSVFAIPGVRGIEFGDGFAAAAMKGSEHNDPIVDADGTCARNGAGGINGGLTNGNPIVFRVAFKPTASISAVQETFDFNKNSVTAMSVPGRHDVCFALRTPVVVEAVTAIVLADLL